MAKSQINLICRATVYHGSRYALARVVLFAAAPTRLQSFLKSQSSNFTHIRLRVVR